MHEADPNARWPSRHRRGRRFTPPGGGPAHARPRLKPWQQILITAGALIVFAAAVAAVPLLSLIIPWHGGG